MKQISFLFILCMVVQSCTNPSHNLLITNVNVIDVATGEVLPNRTVAINGDSISAIYTKTIIPGKQTEVVDGTGKYLIPGLWDMHAHYNWYPEENDLLMIPNGVLGVRDPWGDPLQAKELREQHRQGTYYGVDIFTSGNLIDGSPSYYGSAEVDTPEEARAMVNCQIEYGVDFVKPYSGLKKDVYLALMDEANKLGVIAAGHVPNVVSLEEAVAAGHRIDDHIYGIESLMLTPAQFDTVYQLRKDKKWGESKIYINLNKDIDLAQERLDDIKNRDIWFCPTYVSLAGVLKVYKEQMEADPRNEYVPIVLKYHGGSPDDFWLENPMYESAKPDSIKFIEDEKYLGDQEESIRLLIRSGTKMLAGTDYIIPYIYPGFSLQEEMQVFVRFGMTPFQALRTATINPAQFMKNDKVGEVKVGKSANVLLLNANPLEDIQHAQDIHAVVLRGKHLDRAHLNGLLDKAKQLAKARQIHEWFAPRFEAEGIEASVQAFLENRETIDQEYPIRWNMLISAGWKFYKEDKKEEAIALAKLTEELYPDFIYAIEGAASVYKYCGKKEMARMAYQKALEIYPCWNILERYIKELDEPMAFGKKYQSKEPAILAARLPCMHHNY